MLDIPILDENGILVPDSWYTAKDTGALSFFAEEPCPECGTCRRFYVEGLRCYACSTPPAPMWGVTAPNLETALARKFSHYRPADPCAAHPRSNYVTESQCCAECRREEAEAARADAVARRAAQDAEDKAAYLALVRDERKLDRERRAEERKLEAAAQTITRTVGRAGKGRKRTTERAVKLINALPDDTPTPTPKGSKPRREAAPKSRKSTRGSTRRK